MAYDPDRITKIVSEARSAMETLETMGQLPSEAFVEDADKVGNAKYSLIVAIEACLDLAHHVISMNDLRMPEDYADAFTVLAENDVIDEAFGERLAGMAPFRDRLVHIYWDVDDRQVHRYIREDISDVGSFIDELLDQLDAET